MQPAFARTDFCQGISFSHYSGRRHRVEILAPFFLLFLFFVYHFQNMHDQFEPALLRWLNGRVASTSYFEFVGLGSIPGGRVSNVFFYSFFL